MYTTSTVRVINPGFFHWNTLKGTLETIRDSSFQSNITVSSTTRQVTAVLVLCGLPRDLTASILAHEAMHVYLKLTNDFPCDITPMSEEGLCQFIASKYLEFHSSSSYLEKPAMITRQESDEEASIRDNKLKLFFLHSIAVDLHPVYGDGFRKASRSIDVLGLEQVLDIVKQTKTLPEV